MENRPINPEAKQGLGSVVVDPFSELPPTVDQTIEVAKIAAREAFAANPDKGEAPNRLRRFFAAHFGDQKKSQATVPIKTTPQSSPIEHTPRI
jgi:hypothetical protein